MQGFEYTKQLFKVYQADIWGCQVGVSWYIKYGLVWKVCIWGISSSCFNVCQVSVWDLQ